MKEQRTCRGRGGISAWLRIFSFFWAGTKHTDILSTFCVQVEIRVLKMPMKETYLIDNELFIQNSFNNKRIKERERSIHPQKEEGRRPSNLNFNQFNGYIPRLSCKNLHNIAKALTVICMYCRKKTSLF